MEEKIKIYVPAHPKWGLAMQSLIKLDFANEKKPLDNIDWELSYVALDKEGKHLLGTMIVERKKNEKNYISYLVVRDHVRGQGIGKKLLSLLSRKNTYILTCQINKADYYLKMGFYELFRSIEGICHMQLDMEPSFKI